MFILAVFLAAHTSAAIAAPPSRALHPILDGRIVGGTDADIAQYPYTISLLRYNSHTCGGVIISPTWIVTAAHCLNTQVDIYSVRAGSTYRNSGGQVIPASNIFIHANYSTGPTDYDIGLVQLEFPITIDNARPIGLAPQGTGPVPGEVTTITGWGTLAEGGSVSTTLQVVDVPVVSQAVCQDAYGQIRITDRMFCAGVLGVGGKDACQGDSGGPLIVNGVLVGLVSWGIGCARPNYPGVNTNVPALRSWITAVAGI